MKIEVAILSLTSLLSLPAWAGSRSSLNYSLLTDALAVAGGRLSSPNYSMDAAGDGFCGTGTGHPVIPGHPIIIHVGPIPQRPEVVGLTVSVPSTNANEGAVFPVTATVRYDDGTYADVTGTGARWSAGSPLNASLSNGLVSAGSVYRNTTGTVQANYLGHVASVGLQVLNTNNDDFGSYAGDGLSDAWQVQYFGLNSPNAGPNRDPDGDGQNNAYEFTTGTSPTDPASRFQLSIAKVPGHATWRNLTFGPTYSNRNYQLQFRDAVNRGYAPFGRLPSSTNDTTRTLTDTNATNAARFYGVRITQQSD